ncbi:RING finger and transmembrane domain-containing protein 2-like [Hibiscus syriacus]|uniref:RING finger and transmembrane domain-containing protein 2-like n=2 Tax=Hibiscus syriacus TaxID=106335 RepID=A0A6A2WI30_HIBSY|nr:RING finger and transmembrane domain-containing protein 2-like [Hibiscus syriacus]
MAENQVAGLNSTSQTPTLLDTQTNNDNQLKASREVAMATAAKAKLLLRELKSVKADMAFAKERCAQLEEENKFLRECGDKGDNPADDDLIRVQLESLLAEKGRLAHENSLYARENRFLREIVEYHQLSMQDVLYLDEGAKQVTEVGCPINFPSSTMLCESPTSPSEVTKLSPLSSASTISKEEIVHITNSPPESDDSPNSSNLGTDCIPSPPANQERETRDARTKPPVSSVQM